MIEKVNIAEINTKIDTDSKKFLSSLNPFVYDFRTEPEITAKVVDIELRGFLDKYKGYKSEDAKIRLLAESFFGQLPEWGGFGLKCSLLSTQKGNVYVVVAKDDVSLKQFVTNLMYDNHSLTDNGNMIVALKSEINGFNIFTTPWTDRNAVNVKLPLTNMLVVTEPSERHYANAMQRLLEVMLTSIVLPKKGDVLGMYMELIETMAQNTSIDFVSGTDIERAKRMLE